MAQQLGIDTAYRSEFPGNRLIEPVDVLQLRHTGLHGNYTISNGLHGPERLCGTSSEATRVPSS